jgi:hypothetical protein
LIDILKGEEIMYSGGSTDEFEIGMRVKILRQTHYKKRVPVDSVGTVRSVYSSNIGVELDGKRNERSGYGYYYFKPNELLILCEIEDVNENEIIMEENNMQKITNYINIAKVQFSTNTAPFECANFESLNVGDTVVVKHYKHSDFDLATVVEIVERNDLEVYHEVVARVDTTYYDDRVANRTKVAELKAKMEARAKQLQDIALYQMLAEKDPDMMALLAEYQAVPKM